MDCTLKNYCSKYFYILNILIFFIIVNGEVTPVNNTHYFISNLRKFNSDELEEFCNSFDTVLADVNVIFDDLSDINNNSMETLKRLQSSKKKIILYQTIETAGSSLTETLPLELQTRGLHYKSEIFNPISAFKWYLNKNSFSGKAYVIGDSRFQDFILSQNISIVSDSETLTVNDYENAVNGTLDTEVKAVIIGFDIDISLYKVIKAHRYLKNPEVQLFVTQPKGIVGANYYQILIKKIIKESKKTEQSMDQLDGIFGNYLVEMNGLNDKVLFIPSGQSGGYKFAKNKRFKILLLGKYKLREGDIGTKEFYGVPTFAKMPICPYDV